MSRKRIFGTAILAAADRSLRQECAQAGPRQYRVLAWGEETQLRPGPSIREFARQVRRRAVRRFQ